MTRKHFKAIAATVASIADLAERRKQAEAHAATCAQANPRFDRSRFLAACGVE